MTRPQISDRKFGLQIGIGLLVLAAFGLWRGWWLWLVIALVTLGSIHFLFAWLAPTLLGPVNRAWMGLGHLLGKVVAPVVLSFMYGLLFVPIGLVMRASGRDALKLRERDGESFWLHRSDASIEPASFFRQY